MLKQDLVRTRFMVYIALAVSEGTPREHVGYIVEEDISTWGLTFHASERVLTSTTRERLNRCGLRMTTSWGSRQNEYRIWCTGMYPEIKFHSLTLDQILKTQVIMVDRALGYYLYLGDE